MRFIRRHLFKWRFYIRFFLWWSRRLCVENFRSKNMGNSFWLALPHCAKCILTVHSRSSFSLIAYPIRFAVLIFGTKKNFLTKTWVFRNLCHFRPKAAKSASSYTVKLQHSIFQSDTAKRSSCIWSKRYRKFIQGISYPNCWCELLGKARINVLYVSMWCHCI